jgi:hypothetical protein
MTESRCNRGAVNPRFRRPNTGFGKHQAGNELQQTAELHAALWECAEAADCPHPSLIDTEAARQLLAIRSAWSRLSPDVRTAIVAIVKAGVPTVEQAQVKGLSKRSD